MKITCDACFRGCTLEEGMTGACHARANKGGTIVCESYGRLTSIALDPIEKKPLNRFYPGSMILSVGSYGCNLKCPFCQNYSISLAGDPVMPETETYTPELLCEIADRFRDRGNIGIAFTYNEPLTGYEFVRDTARLAKNRGLKNVLVTNGCFTQHVFEEISPYIDAMNIDLKCFSGRYYKDVLEGDFETVKAFIQSAVKICHVELTTLIIPGENDSDEEMEELSAWVSTLEAESGKKIPLHLSRFFPMNRYEDRRPTNRETIHRLADVARRKLEFVYLGNM